MLRDPTNAHMIAKQAKVKAVFIKFKASVQLFNMIRNICEKFQFTGSMLTCKKRSGLVNANIAVFKQRSEELPIQCTDAYGFVLI